MPPTRCTASSATTAWNRRTYAPAAPGIAMLVRPFLAPFQRILPSVGGIDLSPLALLVVVNVLLLVLGRIG